jgi:transcriptional regulator with XRE-family HTH domain
MKLLKENFERILKEKGMTQLQVAQNANIDPATVSRVINENKDPRLKSIAKIAEGLGCEMWELMYTPGTGAMAAPSAWLREIAKLDEFLDDEAKASILILAEKLAGRDEMKKQAEDEIRPGIKVKKTRSG